MSNAGSTKALARPWRGLSPGLSKAVPTALARTLRGLSAGSVRGLWLAWALARAARCQHHEGNLHLCVRLRVSVVHGKAV